MAGTSVMLACPASPAAATAAPRAGHRQSPLCSYPLRGHTPTLAEGPGQAVGHGGAGPPGWGRVSRLGNQSDYPLRGIPRRSCHRRRPAGPGGPGRARALPGPPARRARRPGAPEHDRPAEPGHRRSVAAGQSPGAWDEGPFGPPLAARRAGSAPGHAMPQQWRMHLQRMQPRGTPGGPVAGSPPGAAAEPLGPDRLPAPGYRGPGGREEPGCHRRRSLCTLTTITATRCARSSSIP